MLTYETRDGGFCAAICRRLAAALVLVVVGGIGWAEDWPQFRGPTGQGLSQATGLPVEWDLDRDMPWKVSVPGKGWSSPIVHDGRIFLTTPLPVRHRSPMASAYSCISGPTERPVWIATGNGSGSTIGCAITRFTGRGARPSSRARGSSCSAIDLGGRHQLCWFGLARRSAVGQLLCLPRRPDGDLSGHGQGLGELR
jgi:hypothetical protein